MLKAFADIDATGTWTWPWDLHTSRIEWLGPHERDHAGMIAKL